MSDGPLPLPGQTFVVTVGRPVAGGRMIAHHAGQVVLVAGAIAGERVVARVERRARGVVLATTAEVLDASPARRPLPVDPSCGGLSLGHVVYEQQVEIKRQILLDTLRRIAKISWSSAVPFQTSPEHGYRLRSRLHVDRGRVGFFREGTHDLCAAGPSRQLSEEGLAAAERLGEAVAARGLPVTAMSIVENVRGSARIALLELTEGRRLTSLDPVGIVAGIDHWSVAGGATSRAPAPVVRDEAPDLGLDLPVAWSRRAASFFQGNRYLVGPLLSAVLAQASGERIVDLYAGVGLFSVPLAARGVAVLAVEGDPISGGDLIANAAPWRGRLDVRVAPVETALARLGGVTPATVIVDPPRTGLSVEVRRRLAALGPRRIVYVSCDPPTLARDAQELVAAGYGVSHLESFDMFPCTPHVETLMVFDRRHLRSFTASS